jgi:hypothetical protein
MPPFVFVVGCPRSGTSPFARWLHACGLSSVSDERRHERYPAGYFEHMPALIYLTGLERLPRATARAIKSAPYLTSELLEDPFLKETFELAFRPVLEREVEFLKLPQLALSIDFLFERFGDVHVVALWREPAPSFRSLVTREFTLEMRLSAGFRSVLLWSVYARHMINAKRARPDRVTLVNVDHFFDSPEAGAKLLERIGRDPAAAVPFAEAVDPKIWNRPLGPGWRLYHAAMSWACRALASRMGPEREPYADQGRWQRELRDQTDLP